MKVRVACHAGYKADEKPLRFWLDDREYSVEQILDQWYGPGHTFFKLMANDGNLYVLRSRMAGSEVEWSLEAFRKPETPEGA